MIIKVDHIARHLFGEHFHFGLERTWRREARLLRAGRVEPKPRSNYVLSEDVINFISNANKLLHLLIMKRKLTAG